MKKKNITILFTIILLIIVMTVFIVKDKEKKNLDEKIDNTSIKYEVKKEEISLINMLKEKTNNKSLSINVNTYKNNYFNGTLTKAPEGAGFGTTKAIFIFKDNNLDITEYDFKTSIYSFSEYQDKVYYIENQMNAKDFSWALIENNKDFTNRKVLLSGTYSLVTLSPKLILTDKLYFIGVNDTTDENNNLITQEFSCYEITSSGIQKIYSNNYKENEKYITNLWNVSINDKKINYLLQTKDNEVELYSYDIANQQNKLLITTDSISNYIVNNDFFAISTTSENDNKSYLKVYCDGNEILSEEFIGRINIYNLSDNTIYISKEDESYIYNYSKNTIYDVEFNPIGYTIREYDKNKLFIYNEESSLIIEFIETKKTNE